MIPALVAAAAALVHLFAEDSLGPLAPLVKMTPVAILGGLVLRSSRAAPRRVAGAGLLVGAAADAVIEFSFIGGLVVFLVAHLLYIAAFVRIDSRLRLLRLAPVALWAAAALPVLVAHAGALAVPVLVYGLVIFTMIWRAAAAVERPGWNAGTFGFLGAMLFGISDTLLGWARFVPGPLSTLPASNALILGAYWAGQTLIAIGFLKRA